MKPFIVLIAVFFLVLGVTKFFRKEVNLFFIARLALSSMLVFTSIGHFLFLSGMTAMIPEFLPYKTTIIVVTGIFEILAAIGLHLNQFRTLTGWLLIAFFLLILPANIYAAMNNINYQTGALDGNGLGYLWFRIPFQILLIFWTYYSAIKYKV